MTFRTHVATPKDNLLYKLLAAGWIFFIAIFPFLRLVKFPFNLPLLALVSLIFIYILWGQLSLAGIRETGSLTVFMKRVAAVFIVVELLFDLALQPMVNYVFKEPADYSSFGIVKNNTSFLLKQLVFAWFSAALAEEVVYRGVLQLLLERTGLPVYAAAMMQAIVFSSAHAYQGWSGMLITFLFGLAFSVIYLYSGRKILTVVLIHGLVDSLFLLLAYGGWLQWYENPYIFLFS